MCIDLGLWLTKLRSSIYRGGRYAVGKFHLLSLHHPQKRLEILSTGIEQISRLPGVILTESWESSNASGCGVSRMALGHTLPVGHHDRQAVRSKDQLGVWRHKPQATVAEQTVQTARRKKRASSVGLVMMTSLSSSLQLTAYK